MKNINVIAILMLFCLVGCEVETPNLTETEVVNVAPEQVRGLGFGYPDDQLIVRFIPGTTEIEKQALRVLHGVIDYKNCDCAAPTIELWYFDMEGNSNGGGTLEEKVIVIKDDEGIEDAEFNSTIQNPGLNLQTPPVPSNVQNGIAKVKAGNDAVVIAVLDTGIDYNYFGFDQPFLFDSVQGETGCDENGDIDYFGWDFVNQDHDPYDDYGHGTIISSMIVNRLQSQNIDFRILPVKVFNETGKGNYFDILCGFRYAATNKYVDIINMSFGWNSSNTEILGHFISESEEEVLLTTSAGNSSKDNDLFPHFPSSFETSNILANAALSESLTHIGLAWFSNKGAQSVDIAAPGSNLPFYLTPTELISVNGTSYSNAIVSAYAAAHYQDGMTVTQLRSIVLQNAIYHANLFTIKHSAYIAY